MPGPAGSTGVTGLTGPSGPAGSAGAAIAFDLDGTEDTNPGNMATTGTMANLIAAVRGEDLIKVRDVYWDVVNGKVYQYQGSSDITDTSTSVSFEDLTQEGEGFINPEATIGGFVEEFPFIQTWPQPLSASTDGYIELSTAMTPSASSETTDTFWIPASPSGVAKQPFLRGQVSMKLHNMTLTNHSAAFSIVPQVRGFTESPVLIGTPVSTATAYDDDDEGVVWRRVRISGNHLKKIASGAGFLTTSSSFVTSSSPGAAIEHAYYDGNSDWTEFLVKGTTFTTSTPVYYQLQTSQSGSFYNTAGPETYITGYQVSSGAYDAVISAPFYVTLPQTTDTRGVRIKIAREFRSSTSGTAYAQILSVSGSLGLLK